MSWGSKIQQNKAAAIAVSALCLVTVVIVDCATGPEVSLSIFYLVPGVLTSWAAGRNVGIAFATISSVLWLGVELAFGKSYQHTLVPYGNGLLKMVMALFAAFLTAMVREREQALLREMAGRKKAEMELDLERALAEGIEAEQQRLGKDIHDGLGQHLVSTGFVASMLMTKLKEKGLPEEKDAQELTGLISDAIGQSRSLARGLFPVKLEAEGLPSALLELTNNITARFGIACQFESNCSDTNASPGVSANLFRIAQEAVNNAVKHAQPNSVVVKLRQTRSQLELTIFNDGREYLGSAGSHSGMGLQIMEQRARVIGGKFTIGAGPVGGTMVQCSVPVDSRKNEDES
jgi:signal transduction histidine kinase